MTIAEMVYRLTESFPKTEAYGLTSQVRRSAVSVAANIAERHGREQSGLFVQFLRVSQGSLKEMETELLLSVRVKLTSMDDVEAILARCDDLGRMLRSLIRSIQRKQSHE